jgi:DNA-binding transcriptional ArsR family regulator
MDDDRQRYAVHAAVFATLGNPVRHELFHLICSGRQTAAELAPLLGISPSNLSQHLAALQRAGLIERERRDGQVVWRIVDRRLTQACDLIDQVIGQQLKSRAQALERKASDVPQE